MAFVCMPDRWEKWEWRARKLKATITLAIYIKKHLSYEMMSFQQFRPIPLIIAVYLFVLLANPCLPTGWLSKDLHLVILQTDWYVEIFSE